MSLISRYALRPTIKSLVLIGSLFGIGLVLFQNFTGLNTITSRQVIPHNGIFAGTWGFDELSQIGD